MMSQLASLKASTSLKDVAALINFKAPGLAFILYKKPLEAKYRTFEINKRGGGTRTINAPSDDLMLVQRRIADILQDCVQEINEHHNRKDEIAHGFKRERSIITNASKHREKRYVFNIDLQDFFGTINFGRVRGFFISDNNFALHPTVATILAQIACHQNSLPQGSPCSPVISNLVGHLLDVHLVGLAAKGGCTYSRYADDLTFSTNKSTFPPGIAKQKVGESHVWEPGDKLHEIVTHAGFTINDKKTRMQYRNSRQDVTGLVVNRKVNIRSDYRRTVRAMAHRLFISGTFERVETARQVDGASVSIKKTGTLNQLHGMFGHIDRVDWHNAEASEKAHPAKEIVGVGSKENLYRRFLLYKEFHVAPAPIVVCEGKTDNVYLKQAIRSLAHRYPLLASIAANGAVTVKTRIFQYPHTSTGRILGLNGGSGDLKNLIDLYRKESVRFKALGRVHPISKNSKNRIVRAHFWKLLFGANATTRGQSAVKH
jgi:RNA-directed DNA polymerase